MRTSIGLRWPTSLGETDGRRMGRIITAHKAASTIARMAHARRVCVQAGGHVGVWPLALSRHFQTVYTFEPDWQNWQALTQNVTAANVFAARAVLRQAPGGVSLTRPMAKSGMWQTVPGGPIPSYTVDGLGLPALDALVLDVEGDELAALRGARTTIRAHHPLVWYEARFHGDEIARWLQAEGYEDPRPISRSDVVSVWRGHAAH